MEKHELSKQEALDKAQAYCARSEHCAADVRRKLWEWGIEPSLHDFIEEKLFADCFLNNERFCKAYVHDKVAYNCLMRPSKKQWMSWMKKRISPICISSANNINPTVKIKNYDFCSSEGLPTMRFENTYKEEDE